MRNYRKILMFDTDKLYFSEGTDRFVVEMVSLKGRSFRVGRGYKGRRRHLHGHQLQGLCRVL